MTDTTWGDIEQQNIFFFQFCMSFSLSIAMETEKNVLYVDTNGSFDIARWHEMMEARQLDEEVQDFKTLWPRQISQMTFSNAFPWKKMCEFRLRFDWSLFIVFEFTIFQHWFR